MLAPEIRDMLVAKELKVTPQRIAVLDAIITMRNHPTAEQVIEFLRKNYPNIATGTVYKVLDTLVENEIIFRVKTDRDIMRYDADLTSHHHLYYSDSDEIGDYYDRELDKLLQDYFSKKSIPGFAIEDIKLQIIGRFKGSGIKTEVLN